MRPTEEIKQLIENLSDKTSARMDRRVREDMLRALAESEATPALARPNLRRHTMNSPITKLAAAVVVIAAVALSIAVIDKVTSPVYALEQTVEALKNVRFLHILGRDDQGRITDERWIEIGMDGRQVRYRQQNPQSVTDQHPGAPRVVIEDGESTAVYRGDKHAVIIYDRKDMQYQWVGPLGKAIEDLRRNGKLLKANDIYQGRPAHKVWWPFLSAECYVDPQTKLPIAIGKTELSYEDPPAGTFEITIPNGYAVLDKRPGAPEAPTPQWLLDEENAQANKGKCFREGSLAFARGDYEEAAKQFELALGWDSWAPFWLGSAYYKLGQYDLAIENYNKEFDIWTKHDPDSKLPYCNYARGLAYAMSGDLEAATADFQACLPAMMRTLRIPSGGAMFEYAENPLVRYGQYKPTERQMVVNMVNRLRTVSGQNFGYDAAGTPEQKEAAIAAWEQWSRDSGKIKFSPEAERILLPESPQ